MDICFADLKLEKECNDAKLLQRRHGKVRATKLQMRLSVLREAKSLSDLGVPYTGPHRCHELHGRRAGQFSVDLDQPYRLIFKPTNEPPPQREEGGLDWKRITTIEIIGIEDTHE
jgi:plasmid maintenance system killer protein